MRKSLIAAFVCAGSMSYALAAPSGMNWQNGQRLTDKMLQQFDTLKANQTDMNSLSGQVQSKVAAINGSLQNPNIQGGSAPGMDVSQAVVGTVPLSYAMHSSKQRITVYIGGANKFSLLSSDVAKSVNSGKIALYEHANGLANLTDAQRQAVQAAWASTGAALTTGGGVAMGEIGQGFGPNNVANFGGAFPAIDTVNISDSGETYTAASTDAVPGKVYQHYISADYVTQAQASFATTMNGTGAKLLLPFIPIWINTDDMFSVGGYWANARNLAISAGGIALDFPSNDAIMNGDSFINSMADAIKWAEANHLAAVLVLSPYTATGGNCGYQANLLRTSQLAVAQLRKLGAIPTAYAIENYCQTGDGSTVNTASGDGVQGSLNQVALWLASQPVADPGTVAPTGGLSESQINTNPNGQVFTALGVNNARSALPTGAIPLTDISNMLSPSALGGDLGYQSAYDFSLIYGNIGDGSYLKKPIKIFLNALSSFTTQAPITFQGQGTNGNQALQGGSDQYAHLMNNFNSVVGNIGLKLGIDANAPLMYRVGNRFGFRDELALQGGTLMQGSSSTGGNEETSVMDDGLLHIFNNYSSADYATGLALGSKLGDPSIAVTNDRNTVKISALNLQLPSNLTTRAYEIGSQTTAGGVTLDFHTDGTSTTDYNSRIYASGNNLLFYANNVSINGMLALENLTTAQVEAFASPSPGYVVNDTTINQPVIYENGHWYPIQLGAALQ